MSSKFTLSNESYSIKNIILWGTCAEHFQRAFQEEEDEKGGLCHRAVHLFLGIVELPPIIGQIIALFEMIIVSVCCAPNDDKVPNKKASERLHSPNVKPLAGRRHPTGGGPRTTPTFLPPPSGHVPPPASHLPPPASHLPPPAPVFMPPPASQLPPPAPVFMPLPASHVPPPAPHVPPPASHVPPPVTIVPPPSVIVDPLLQGNSLSPLRTWDFPRLIGDKVRYDFTIHGVEYTLAPVSGGVVIQGKKDYDQPVAGIHTGIFVPNSVAKAIIVNPDVRSNEPQWGAVIAGLHQALVAPAPPVIPVVIPPPPTPPAPPAPPVARLMSKSDETALLDAREPLTSVLKKYFVLDRLGYILKVRDDVDPTSIGLKLLADPSMFQHFYDVSRNGDAAFATDIRTTLAGMNIAPPPVARTAPGSTDLGTQLPPNVRPYSYVPGHGAVQGTDKPPTHKHNKEGAYLGEWGLAIRLGYKDYRTSLGVKPRPDKVRMIAQRVDDERRVERAKKLYRDGWILGRVASLEEVRDFVKDRYHMGNDILSTSLWPAEGSAVHMRLFIEHGATVGIMLDPTRVGKEDYGVGFKQNAVTVGTGFLGHQHRKGSHGDGVNNLGAQRDLFQVCHDVAQEGGDVNLVEIHRRPDGSGYDVKKPDVRGGAVQQPSLHSSTVSHNEQTYNRGIEGDFFLGFFVKSESDNFARELTEVLELQDEIRRKQGISVPIFQLRGSTNTIEEIVPDELVLAVTGLAGKVEPMDTKESSLSRELKEAEITVAMASSMFTTKETGSDAVKSLLALQLLMFNMRNLTGKMSVLPPGETTPQEVRLLDNLHLVFPTIHRTKNKDAEQPDLHFSPADVQFILGHPEVANYLKASLKYNLKKFLGIEFGADGKVAFNPKNADLFDQTDVKKSDFAKVLSRAMQCATLFQIYDADTEKSVRDIVQVVRAKWPHIGFSPTSVDMILGSNEMQAICAQPLVSPQSLEKPSPAVPADHGVPPCTYSLENLDPFNMATALPQASEVHAYLDQLKDAHPFMANDQHLVEYEKNLLKAVQVLRLIEGDQHANEIMQSLRAIWPTFGFTADGKDRTLLQSDLLVRWVSEKRSGNIPPSEFPFPCASAVAAFENVGAGGRDYGRARRGALAMHARGGGRFARGEGQSEAPTRFSRGAHLAAMMASDSTPPQRKLTPEELRGHIMAILPSAGQTQEQIATATALGLYDPKTNEWLWERIPQFFQGEVGKPLAPYIEPTDILGEYAMQLLTGPAFDPATLQRDRATFDLRVNFGIAKGGDLERLVTHTLAVTTEGDKQVLRPNGLHYSHAVHPPMGGHIQFNGGNEKHTFEQNIQRQYIETVYTYRGAYSVAALKEVEAYDLTEMLSDEERRLKRATIVQSGMITITARGGYGSERIPLAQPIRALYVAAAGPQFEKYGNGDFIDADGQPHPNELECADFIIKEGAAANPTPLFPIYYEETGNVIPAHSDVNDPDIAELGDRNYSPPFVRLKDGAFFNRNAFQVATKHYLHKMLLATVVDKTGNGPFYLKATLFGGGFFANANEAGNLRPEVTHAMLVAYLEALRYNLIPAGSAIEFTRYGQQSEFLPALIEALKVEAKQIGVEIIWANEGDQCDFEPKQAESGNQVNPAEFKARVIFGAADVMSWAGNERTSASVEAALANNSNLRLVMNWWANHHVFGAIKTASQLLAQLIPAL